MLSARGMIEPFVHVFMCTLEALLDAFVMGMKQFIIKLPEC